MMLTAYNPKPSVTKLVNSIIIKPGNPSGATECYIISEPLLNHNLAHYIVFGSLPMSSRLDLFEQMLEGLTYLHDQGCMHRDLKPENILVSTLPIRAVIIDFGCATWEKSSKDHMKGTIRYLAPEVIALKEKAGSRGSLDSYDLSADVWSMGLTAEELMRGSRFGFKQICREDYDGIVIPGPSDIGKDDWASQLIRHMLQWEAKARIKAKEAYRRCVGYRAARDETELRVVKRARRDT